MGALTSFTKWNPQDDLLLKNAVEAGASLESLAKGAVNFSRRITVRELEDRWRLLLYDLNTSTEASARIIDIEIGVSAYNPSKPGRACNSKLKENLTGRRKVDSLQCHYYAARKKARSESHRSANFGFLVLPSSHVGTESYLNNQFKLHNEFTLDKSPINVPSSDNYLHLETNYDVNQHVYPKMVGIESNVASCNHAFHGGMVGSVETELPDGMLGRDCSFANLENISCIPIDEAGLSDARQRFEANVSENEFPCALDLNHCSSQAQDVPESRPTHSLALSNANADVDIEIKSSRDFSSMNSIQENVCCALGGNLNPGQKIAESCSTFNQLGYSSSPPGLPIWKTIVEDATPTLRMDAQFEEKGHGVLIMEHVKKMDHQASDDVTPKGKLNDGTSAVVLINSSMLSEDNYIDFPSPGLAFTDDEEEVLLFDVDVDDFGDRSCLNGLGSILLSSPADNQMDNLTDPGESKPSEALDTGITACKNESSMEHEAIPVAKNIGSSNLDCSIVPGVSNMPSSSRASPPAALMEKLTICVLNTEDLDVPCNDDVSFPAKFFQAFATTNLRQNVSSTVTNDGKAASGNSTLGKEGKTTKLPPNMAIFKAGQSVLPKVGLLQSTTDGVLDPMLAERDLTSGAFGNSNIGKDDANLIPPAVNSHSAPGLSLKQEATIELNSEAVMPKFMPSHSDQLGYIDPLPTMSVSDQEEQPSDNDDDDEAPSFSDIEAMILDMDLGPYDMESSLFTKEVSRYQCLNTKKSIIRLEQGARSYMNRTISSHGAFAIFYGRHLKYFIRTPEVLLGRETEDIKVDIDLGKEGRANKISRRQAIIKMDEDGCFHLKNIGKSSIFVNSKEVPVKKRINLCISALIEIKDMRFIFEVNEPAVKHHITSLTRYIKKPKSEFDFGYT